MRPNFFQIDTTGALGDTSAEIEVLGQVYQEIVQESVDSNGFQFAQLRVVLFCVEGDHPVYGRMQILLDTSRPGTYGYLLATQPGEQYPVIHTTYLNVVAVAEKFPGLVLQNRGDPLMFVSDPLTAWPPDNNVYRLKLDVDFEPRANPGATILTARKAPVYLSKG